MIIGVLVCLSLFLITPPTDSPEVMIQQVEKVSQRADEGAKGARDARP